MAIEIIEEGDYLKGERERERDITILEKEVTIEWILSKWLNTRQITAAENAP